jgi:hypothetical protein
MQHILTPGGAVSQILKILDLMVVILSHVGLSYGLLMLAQSSVRNKFSRMGGE